MLDITVKKEIAYFVFSVSVIAAGISSSVSAGNVMPSFGPFVARGDVCVKEKNRKEKCYKNSIVKFNSKGHVVSVKKLSSGKKK
ncbi:hypothetical protein [Chromatium okenii]|jgi:hypothetical protein|uniref:hypothetical protein n=1 Tax=Chromatium okenii TaxID=61644 RepID=UPI0011AFE15E|nr:hypothetical protein [Chromatium okenii]MBV5308524.1 hypothetical protein [Chromatium okenii]